MEEVTVAIHGSESSPCSNDLEGDSTDSALRLLLDFPISDVDMSFLEDISVFSFLHFL
ncbi:hypothetical protein AtNW77_Chr3g0216061 [Arabidopsis thaliana]